MNTIKFVSGRSTSALLILGLIAVVGAAATACSGSSKTDLDEPADSGSGTGLPCCHRGFLYRCANETALQACSDSERGDTTDCTKTSTTCGGGGASPSATSSSPAQPAPPTGRPAPTLGVGEKCTEDAECADRLCVVFGTGTAGFCTKTCATAASCPSKFRCELAEKIGSKVCVPVGDKRLGETCTYNLDCESNLCLATGSATLGYCTAQCTVPADCPANWRCDPISGASGKFCFRP